MSSLRVLYLHGFASGPSSSKARTLARSLAARGLEMERPDLNLPSFEALSLAAQRSFVMAALARDPRPAVLVGSSLGGLVAALVADAAPSVAAVILLAPAFDLAARWRENLPPDAHARWSRDGVLPFHHYGDDREYLLHRAFLEEADTLPPFPSVAKPACVVQGRRDVTVPHTLTRRWVDANPHVKYVEVDDDHLLAASLPVIAAELSVLLDAVPPSGVVP